MKKTLLFLMLFLFSFCAQNEPQKTTNTTPSEMKKQYLFVGTYTKKEGHVDGKGKGIYQVNFDAKVENIKNDLIHSKSFEAVNPSYVSISPDKKYLYAAHELGPNDGDSGTIGAYRIDEKTKDLHLINTQITNGFAPCHVTIDATNSIVIVSNYVGGVVCVYPIQKDGGLQSASQIIKLEGKGLTDRQESSHPHSSTISPDNKFVFIADLGTDKISSYRLDLQNHKLLPSDQGSVKIQDGAGPRHFAFHPNGKFAYVVNELDGTVNVFDYNSTNGNLNQKQSLSTIPEGYKEFNACADIHVHPSGKYVLASNRGHNSIAIFKVNGETGTLELIGTPLTDGDFPRNFTIDPSGNYVWVANQNTDNIVQFKLNMELGTLEKVGSIKIPTPVCLKFL